MEPFKVIGYYICETIAAAECLGVGERILSVSGCIGEQHPRQGCFLGWRRKGESEEYRRFLKLNDEQYRECVDMAHQLFDLKRIDMDCRFLELSDAQCFRKRSCSEIDCCVVCVSTTPECFELLAKEMKDGNGYGSLSGIADDSLCIGSDILGWDHCGFHSFLCNSLQDELPGARFNETGLLGNDFQDVIGFAEQIEGLGEPVEWIPCRLGVYE